MAKILIKVDMSNLAALHCDNPRCRRILTKGMFEWGEHLVGHPCPCCGSDMLTRKDYEDTEKMLRRIAWINKWFGWLGTEEANIAKAQKVDFSVRCHDGKKIIKRERE